MRAPSGEQFELVAADQRAVVVEVGGGLRTYSAAGRELLLGYGANEMCTSGRGQVLAPWPNRLEDGRYEFEGRTHQLPVDDLETHSAIHGLVRWSPWQLRERQPDRVVLEHALHPRPGYPFSLTLALEYTLSGDGLSVRTTATNVGSEPCPYGAGAHPYLAVADVVDDVTLRVPARTVLKHDERGRPTEAVSVDRTTVDFREACPVGAQKIDHTFTDLARDDDGRARIKICGPGGLGATLWADAHYPYVQVFTGELPDVGRRGLAVEPMTCPANALATGTAVLRIEPGQSVTGTWGIAPASLAG